MGSTSVTVKSGHCVHRGKDRFMPGDCFEAGEKEADRLVGKGVVSTDKEKIISDDILEAAKKAIEGGEVTKGGKPSVEAMEKFLGKNISAEQRDAAFEKLTADG